MAWSVRDGPRPLALALIALALLVGLSRIYVGKHYPSDVAGGLLVGTAAGSLAGQVPPLRTPSGVLRPRLRRACPRCTSPGP